eukprot:CAMPEP_0171330808 /NCGR_PEP_ID=MMETSP0878-20121228/2255_1 /TAXON_ID=67004 /ORGANISM="Thalassiosira weissflogii, Strain CCMP1336" /LENGTH=247 /DNA_ID=CAMNT_0011831185 /DNA_START=63 /DNA_END=803 /DNA_ORIENTATION=+
MSFIRPISSIVRAAVPAFRATAAPSTFHTPAIATSMHLPTAHDLNCTLDNPGSSSNKTIRSKHSATQVKRLFKQNPARLRLQKRQQQLELGQPPNNNTPPKKSKSKTKTTTTPAEDSSWILDDEQETEKEPSSTSTATPTPPHSNYTPKFPPVFQPKFLKNGWSAPPPPEVQTAHLSAYPFHVKRTSNKPFHAAGFLPVYSDVRVHGTKRTTVIRNVTGDIPVFLTEMCGVLNLNVPKRIGADRAEA